MPQEIGVRVVGADALAAGLDVSAVAVAELVIRETRKYGQLLLTRTRRNASGRPGPFSRTGHYRRSITLAIAPDGPVGSISARVGTNAVQGRRLEFGFAPGIAPQSGVDVLGRQFHQPPYPHFGPAFDVTAPAYAEAIRSGVGRLALGAAAGGAAS